MDSALMHDATHPDHHSHTHPYNTTSSDFGPASHLFPAILQVFVVIFTGYATGRAALISETDSHGLNTFVSRFALPCMLFRAMATMNLSIVNWTMFTSILLSKSVVFFTVLVLSLVLSSKPRQYGRAGIFAIAATQSNDFALAFPIVDALYGRTHPELVPYIYLLGSVSLLILNPIGFCFLEFEKERKNRSLQQGRQRQPKRRWLRTGIHVLWSICSNPINAMTFVGVLANFAFERHIPEVLDKILAAFAMTFSTTALFHLGLKMVGRIKQFTGFRLVVPALLILAKLLFLPLVSRAVIGHLQPGRSSNETEDYANFGFLYGSIPMTPTVFVFSTQYDEQVDIVGTALVLGTFISGPWMFISAQMLSIQSFNIARYTSILATTQMQVGAFGLLCVMWTVVIMMVNGRWRRIPHIFVMGLLSFQFLSCLGMLLWRLSENSDSPWQHYAQFSVFLLGVLGTRVWTAGIAVGLWVLNRWGLCALLRFRWILMFLCLGLPVLATVLTLALGEHSRADLNPAFHYGQTQVLVSAVVLTVSLVLSLIGIVGAQLSSSSKKKPTTRKFSVRTSSSSGEYSARQALIANQDVELDDIPKREDRSIPDIIPEISGTPASEMEIVPFEEPQQDADSYDAFDAAGLHPSPHSSQNVRLQRCPAEARHTSVQRDLCKQLTQEYFVQDFRTTGKRRRPDRSTAGECDPEVPEDHFEQNRHVVLVLFLATSMLVATFLCFWRMFVDNSNAGGVFIELEFLDGVLVFGQGCVVMAIFGFDMRSPAWFSRIKRIFLNWRSSHI
ncbi:hypothetical protein RvY_13365 [Ramazzottius varieornatus]|uniref:DEP domain-containing protein n=1 Tax=Ramazzottius varieornatus TaxID=947166 RepID=A0A1D1VPH0_RAMVA|nr:hypothetical protein RvY_13365 [Ramazzottius varieornatus]